jgi:hypothetical protein
MVPSIQMVVMTAHTVDKMLPRRLCFFMLGFVFIGSFLLLVSCVNWCPQSCTDELPRLARLNSASVLTTLRTK